MNAGDQGNEGLKEENQKLKEENNKLKYRVKILLGTIDEIEQKK